jgi:alkyl hydroperoxide reductase subunit AhpC
MRLELTLASVCTSDLISLSLVMPELKEIGCRVVCIGGATLEEYHQWIEDVNDITQLGQPQYPLVSVLMREEWTM